MFDEFQTLKPLVGKISPESVPVGWRKKTLTLQKIRKKTLCHFLFPLNIFPSDAYTGRGSTAMNVVVYAPRDLSVCLLCTKY